ncbi:hypothetical protein F5B20DRAFT_307382 [Whalleya microplaca]|nr:hypothetical protein F5B20DRAFT_307382 [Whalleya microplaca]
MHHYTTIAHFCLLLFPSASYEAPISAAGQIPTVKIGNAANKWSADTSKVSQFLSAASSLSGHHLVEHATVALSAEKDELIHKGVLDQQFLAPSSPNRAVIVANNILVDQGTFQFVVDGLTILSNHGASLSRKQVNSIISQINEVRCGRVLPAIDTYFRASSELLHNDLTLVATRPNNCFAARE